MGEWRDLVIPLRALEHFGYCPRQAALIHGDGVWADNVHILRGVRGHRRVDTAPSRQERGRRVLRRVDVWSEQLGLRGRCDVVEMHADGRVVPVEYKMGSRHGLAADLQVCAQALCLEEMLGVSVDEAAVWYGGTRTRHAVAIDDELRQITTTAISALRTLLSARDLPEAANDARCGQCQLLSHCLPELVAAPTRVSRYMTHELFACG
jgi:CRISPR-associated exonuclease Cas4